MGIQISLLDMPIRHQEGLLLSGGWWSSLPPLTLMLTLLPAILCRTRSSLRPSSRCWPTPRTTSSTQRSTRRCCPNPSSSCSAPKSPASWGPINSAARPETQVLKPPDSLALRAGSPHPQMRDSLRSLFLEKKKPPYRPSTLPFHSSSFLSLSLSASLFLFTHFLYAPWKSHSVLALSPEGWRNSKYPAPLPSHTAHFTSSRPWPYQLGRVLEAHEGSGSSGEWGGGRGASAVIGCALLDRSQNVPWLCPPGIF